MAQEDSTSAVVESEALTEQQKEPDTETKEDTKDEVADDAQKSSETGVDDTNKTSNGDSSAADGAADSSASGATNGAASDESPAVKISRLWSAHVAKDEALKNADRLAVSSAYRKWSTSADLGLAEGTPIPAFTDIWVILEKAKDKAEAADAKAVSSNLSGVNKVSVAKTRANADSRAADSADVLAGFAAEAHKVYKDDADEKPAEQGKSQTDGDKKRSKSAEREKGRRFSDRATSSRLDRSLGRDRRRDISRDRKLGGRENATYSKDKSIHMFDDALRQMCKEGLMKELPNMASDFDMRMRRLFPGWMIAKSAFEKFGDLLEAAEKDGLVKVQKRGSQLLVTWVKYDYVIAPRRSPRGSPRRRSRSRRRGGRNRGGDRRRSQDRGGRDHRGRGDRYTDRGRGGRGRGRSVSRRRYRSRTPPRSKRERGDSHDKDGPGAYVRGRGISTRGTPTRTDDRKRGCEPSPEYEYSYAYEYSDEECSPPPAPAPSRSRRHS